MGTGRARIAVSILDADHSNMGFAVRRAQKEGADRIHIDVMDGHFVPNITFGPKMIAGLRKRTKLPLDAHLMISNPLKYIDEFLDAGCDSVTFHVEVAAKQIAPTIEKIHAKGRAAGLAVKPKTPLTALEPYRTTLDIILVMTVEPGFGGQEFMRDVAAAKLLAARDYLRHKPHGAEVHVDGGINRETAEYVGGLGVDVLVVGSVLWIPGRNMGREIRLVKALADEGYQYRLNNGVPPIPRDKMVTFTQLPRHLAMKFMQEIEKGGIPVVPLRGAGQWNPDGDRDFDLLVPATVEDLTVSRHAAAREDYLVEAEAWRTEYAAAHGWKDPPRLP
jgi:ribulose-phosphate 3-epimerase